MAEITWRDGTKETRATPAYEGQGEIRAPTTFEKYRSGREKLTGGVLSKVPLPGGAAESIARGLTPQTPADQGIEIATAGMGPAGKAGGKLIGTAAGPVKRFLAERGARYAAPAIGGATGAMLDKGDPMHALYEGGRGALYGLAGDLIPAAIGLKGRGKAVEQADEKAIGAAVQKAVPLFGGVMGKTDLDAIGIRRHGITAIEDARKAMVEMISQQLKGEPVTGGRSVQPRTAVLRDRGAPDQMRGGQEFAPARVETIPVPGHAGPPKPRPAGHDLVEVPSLRQMAGESSMQFGDAVTWLAKLSDQGWVKDQVASGLTAHDARILRARVRGEIVEQLNARVKGLGDHFDRKMNEMAKGKLFVDLLQQPDVISKGKLDTNALREALTKTSDGVETFAQRLEKLARPEEIAAFYRALQRGGKDLTARDVPGSVGLHLRASPFGGFHLTGGMPSLPQRVGTPPPIKVPSGGTPLSLFAESLTREDPTP